jgi:hypothetical protein
LPCPFISTDIKYTTHNNIERDINNVATKSFELSIFDVYDGIDVDSVDVGRVDIGVGNADIGGCILSIYGCDIFSAINLYLL